MRPLLLVVFVVLAGCVIDNPNYDPIERACWDSQSTEGVCRPYAERLGLPVPGALDMAGADLTPAPVYYHPAHMPGEDCRYQLDCEQWLDVKGDPLPHRAECIDRMCVDVGPCHHIGGACTVLTDCCPFESAHPACANGACR